MRPAPAIAAPFTAAMPTPPQPMTATASPGATLAVFTAAPKPVMTPQPISAARSMGKSLSIFTIEFSCTSIISACDDRLVKVLTWLPFIERRLTWPGSVLTSVSRQSTGRPALQFSQVPQNTDRQVMT